MEADPNSVRLASKQAAPMITEADVKEAQAAWASAIQTISKTYLDKGDFVGAAATAAGQLYGYGKSNVLFKPTKAAEHPFRPTAEEAMSYFVGGKNVKDGYVEDGGFAINGGKGWSDVVFDNHQIELLRDSAIAMGTYYFTAADTGDKTKVEYTFGYKRNDDGKVRIFLHHSSVPFAVPASEPTKALPRITQAEVKEAQARQSSDTPANFDTSFSDLASQTCSRAASIKQANSEQGSHEAFGSKEAYDQQMKFFHSVSEKFNAQLKVHRCLSEGLLQDQQLELSHLEIRHNLSKALGLDVTKQMQSSDERRAAQNREEWLKMCL